MSIEAMKQALEALELHAEQYPHMQKGYTVDAITALRKAIAEAEKQEPVAEYIGNNPEEMDLSKRIGLIQRLTFIPLRSKLYTHPQPKAEKQEREWVGLTDELEALFTNIDHAISSGAWNVQKGSQTWEIIEHAKAAHGIKEKNT